MIETTNIDQQAMDWLNGEELSYKIWNNKYRHNDETFDEWLDRVSNSDDKLKQLIKEKKFLFGGRILANRNLKGKKVSLSNCYVITPPEDNIESIFDCGKKLARTFSYGGGCGVDISKLSPAHAKINNAAKETSGSVSFMDFYSHITGLISQNGRRGALMITLSCEHPDLINFINLKTNPDICTKANISVRITDDFMKAVESNSDWELKFTRPETGITYTNIVKAKEVFTLLAKRNWEMAEPGILYWDNINNHNMLDTNLEFEYAGTNPCAEEPLPAGGSCLLGSINLSEFVINPFSDDSAIDCNKLKESVKIAVDSLNKVLIEGQPFHPLAEQSESVAKWRQIGLGTLGLADMLIKMQIKYGSSESVDLIETVYKIIAETAIRQSLDAAKKYGSYPACNKDGLINSEFIRQFDFDDDTINAIRKYGLFNSQLLTCAPTGSIATMINASTGVEPNFALKYIRRTKSLENNESEFEVESGIVGEYKKYNDSDELPDYFVESKDIHYNDRIKVQSAIQKWTDAAVSSTINLPNESTIEDIYNIYMNAWKSGLKGITVYRAGCQREGILVTESNTKQVFNNTIPPKRPKELIADYYQVKVKGEQFIVIVGLYENKPYEIFTFRPETTTNYPTHQGKIIKKGKMYYTFVSDFVKIENLENNNQNIEEKASSLYSSMLLRHGAGIKYIIKTAKKVDDNISSFTSAMGRILSKYIPKEILKDEVCPKCGAAVIKEGGCVHCSSCEWSKCE